MNKVKLKGLFGNVVLRSKLFIAVLLGISITLSACKKSIDLPHPELEKLFGSWEWIGSSGGFSGDNITPSSAGYSKTVEFRKNGVYRWYKNGKLEDKMRFTVTQDSSSIFTNGLAYIIVYSNAGVLGPDNYSHRESIRFLSHDTLFLSEECSDCYGHAYVRSK